MNNKKQTIEKCCAFKVRTIPKETGSGVEYTIDGARSPRLILYVGMVYIFEIQTPAHPFYITTDAIGGTRKLEGALSIPDNNGTESGEFEFKPTSNMIGESLYYQCNIHKLMGYKITIKNKK